MEPGLYKNEQVNAMEIMLCEVFYFQNAKLLREPLSAIISELWYYLYLLSHFCTEN